MQLNKDDARTEAVRRWRQLPPERRTTYADAEIYAQELIYELDFSTIANRLRLITAWLILEIEHDLRQAEALARIDRMARRKALAEQFAAWQADWRAVA